MEQKAPRRRRIVMDDDGGVVTVGAENTKKVFEGIRV